MIQTGDFYMKLHSYRKMLFHQTPINWQEYYINDQMIYSPRSTEYSRETFPESLHFHDYYELLLFLEGDIRHICETNTFLPQRGDLLVVPPGCLHTSRINTDQTRYTRHVFYLYPSAFDAYNGGALLNFLDAAHRKPFLLALKGNTMDHVMALLETLDNALVSGAEDDLALSQALIIQLFHTFNRQTLRNTRIDTYFPPNVVEIQKYLDEHFTEVASVAEVADHFFYSREYVSRLFKRYLNTTVADYVLQRRISYSQSLILSGLPLIDVCFQSGFGSISTFIRAFRGIMGMTPSAYRKKVLPANLTKQ